MGSVPYSLQLVFPKDEFLLSYLFLDSGYIHHGLYFCKQGSITFHFKQLSRKEVDHLLLVMVGAEGGGRFKRNAIHRGVRLGGASGWADKVKPAFAHPRPYSALEYKCLLLD